MENKELAREIFRIVGPGENVRQASHCMTRLRLQLEIQEVDRDALKELPGVMGSTRPDRNSRSSWGRERQPR